jgi:PAS domain S-box-containing protein
LSQERDRFSDLYDFAPAGYLTLDAKGLIREANLTAARMLGVARADLLGRNLSRFIARE